MLLCAICLEDVGFWAAPESGTLGDECGWVVSRRQLKCTHTSCMHRGAYKVMQTHAHMPVRVLPHIHFEQTLISEAVYVTVIQSPFFQCLRIIG